MISPRIHYAFINSRDLAIFTDADLPPDKASLLPNPIPLPPSRPELPAQESPLLLAPVRGIRRKNLGELALLAALAPSGTRVAVSRAPLNPRALPVHQTWEKFTLKHRIPIGFDVVDRFTPAPGAGSDFVSWLSHATHLVTTSVAEGFGLPFLEAIAHGKPLIGRDLPHLTAAHAGHGIRTGRLYDRILIPIDWVDLTIVRSHLTTTLERNFRYYQSQVTPAIVEATLEIIVRDGQLDFGNLPEALQQEIIERALETTYRDVPRVVTNETTRPLTEWLAETLARRDPTANPGQLAAYSPDAYHEKLAAIYQTLADSSAGPVSHLPPGKILSAYHTPAAFHFLLSAPRRCRLRQSSAR